LASTAHAVDAGELDGHRIDPRAGRDDDVIFQLAVEPIEDDVNPRIELPHPDALECGLASAPVIAAAVQVVHDRHRGESGVSVAAADPANVISTGEPLNSGAPSEIP
jgi:hypothetical protein